jgi:hypothetical protein
MAGLGSAPNDRARAGGANEHAAVPAAALHGSPAYRRDWDFACAVSRPSPYFWRPSGGIGNAPLCRNFVGSRARTGRDTRCS